MGLPLGSAAVMSLVTYLGWGVAAAFQHQSGDAGLGLGGGGVKGVVAEDDAVAGEGGGVVVRGALA